MTFLPIVTRELHVASRRRATFISRSVVAGLLVVLWLFISGVAGRNQSTAQLAQTLFWTYGVLGSIFAVFAGVLFTSDALSAERRDGTLGLLFLTHLKGYDVVLGKLVATSWHGLHSLLTIVPVLALALLMGGVSYAEMARLVVLILSILFYSLSIGLLISTLCRRLVTAMALTFIALFLQCALPWLLAVVLDVIGWWRVEWNPFVLFCPFTPLGFLMDLTYEASLWPGRPLTGALLFWAPVVLLVMMGLFCLVLACLLLPLVWRREVEPRTTPLTNEPQSQQPNEDPIMQPVQLRRRQRDKDVAAFESNPCLWLTRRSRGLSPLLLTLFGLLVAVWLVFYCMAYIETFDEVGFVVALFGAFALHIIVKGWLALESSRRFSDDQQSGAMELLLSTPISPADVVDGELKALSHSFRFPVGMTLLTNLLLLVFILGYLPFHMGDERWWLVELLFLGGCILLLDARAIMVTGMLTALRSTRHHRAFLKNIARVLVPPWLAVFLFFMVMVGGSVGSGEGIRVLYRIWFVGCAAVDWALIVYAKRLLTEHLRWIASGEPGEPATTGGPITGEPGGVAA